MHRVKLQLSNICKGPPPKKCMSILFISLLHISTELLCPRTLDMHALDTSTTQALENTCGFPSLVCASSTPFRPCNGDGLSIPSTIQESRHSKGTVIGCAGDFQLDMEQVVTVNNYRACNFLNLCSAILCFVD